MLASLSVERGAPTSYLEDTDSAANQLGAPQSAENLRHTSVAFGPGCNCYLVEAQNFIARRAADQS